MYIHLALESGETAPTQMINANIKVFLWITCFFNIPQETELRKVSMFEVAIRTNGVSKHIGKRICLQQIYVFNYFNASKMNKYYMASDLLIQNVPSYKNVVQRSFDKNSKLLE